MPENGRTAGAVPKTAAQYYLMKTPRNDGQPLRGAAFHETNEHLMHAGEYVIMEKYGAEMPLVNWDWQRF